MKAVIMAAGEGRRLEPLTATRPKPMLPVANKPLLEYVIEAAIEGGVNEFILVIGYKRERIQSHFGDGDGWGVEMQYAEQEKQLGTGHAILQAEPFVDGSFVVLNGDRILEPRIIEGLLAAESTGEALLAVTRSDQPSDYGVVQLSGEAVRSITEKPPQHATSSDIINAGVYRFDESIFDILRATRPAAGEITVTSALEELATNNLVRMVYYDGVWLDVSHHWDYLRVNAEVIDRFGSSIASTSTLHDDSSICDNVVIGEGTTVKPNATVLPGTSLGNNVGIGPNVVIENSIVLADASIEAGAVIRDCIVAENATIGPNSTVEGGYARVFVNGDIHQGVRLGGVLGDNVTLGGNVTLARGTVVGTGVEVESCCHLNDRIPSNAIVRRG